MMDTSVLTALTIMALVAGSPPALHATAAPDDPEATRASLASIDAVAAQPPVVAIQPSRLPGCPSTAGVEAALLARVPGAVVTYDRAGERRALVLTLVAMPANAGAELTLTDIDGRIRLRRTLSRAGLAKKRADQSDCDALAETAALIVERYLSELDQPHIDLAAAVAPTPVIKVVAPPPPPPRAIWSLGVGNQYAVGELGVGAFDVGLRVSRTLGLRRAFFAYLRAGAGLRFDPLVDQTGDRYQGTAKLQRFPAELGLGWRSAEGAIQPQLSLGAASNVTRVQAESLAANGSQSTSQWLAAPQAVLEGALQMPVARRLYVRFSGAGVLQLVRYEFFPSSGPVSPQNPVFALPARRVQARLSLEVGFSL
jgi:hypothetical protein